MFDPGTKLVVIASSHRGSLGIKKGSLAYYRQDMGNDNVFYDEEHRVFYSAAEMVFFRYGFEKKERCERKKVLILLPKFSENYGDTYAQVAKLSRRIQSGRNDQWNGCRERMGFPSKVPVVMVAPVGITQENLVTCSKSELLAWVEAVTTADVSARWLIEATESQHVSISKHPEMHLDTVFMLRDMASDRAAREHAVKGAPDVQRLVLDIQLMNIIRIRNGLQSFMEYFQHRTRVEAPYRIGHPSVDSQIATCCNAYQLIFRPHYYGRFKNYVLHSLSMKLEPLFEEPETVKGYLLGLSACLLRTGKIDGKKAMSIGQ